MRHAGSTGGLARRMACALVLLPVVAASPRAALAQASPLVIEARGGAAIPVSAFADGSRSGEGTSPGVSFGVDFALPGGGRFFPYVGFSQNRFKCQDAGCPAGGRYVATGFHGGIRTAPLPTGLVIPWLRVGVVTAHVETDAFSGVAAGRSEIGLGGEVGVGVHVGSGPVALSPAVRFVAVNAELPGGALLRMRYLVADLGVVLAF